MSQELLAKINQGRCDSETELLNLIKNSTRANNIEILKAAQQRLKIHHPKKYRQLVGPLHIRDPLGSKSCYCSNAKSLKEIGEDIISDKVPRDALLCDVCWDEDITVAWGTYGTFGKKLIDRRTWQALCIKRGDCKYGA